VEAVSIILFAVMFGGLAAIGKRLVDLSLAGEEHRLEEARADLAERRRELTQRRTDLAARQEWKP
jgi:hypothetical protein